MSLHLRGRIGAHSLLIPASSVLDVWNAAPDADETPSWRGRVLPYVDGRLLLGEPASGPAAALLAYGAAADEPGLVILGLDQVLGSVEISAEMLKPFPPNLVEAHRLFDGVALLAGRSLLRMRAGLDLTGSVGIRITSPSVA